MMTSQISTCVEFTKTQKCRYLKKEKIFFLPTKKFINYISRATLWQKNTFVSEITFNVFINTTMYC